MMKTYIKNMKQILYFIIIGSIISSCSNKKEPDLSQAKSIELQGEIIKSDSDIFIANTDYLQVLDDKIYIYNPIGDFGFIVYDPKNQTYEYLGRKGNGPKEGILYSPFITTSENELCCFDISKNKFLYHKKDSPKVAYKEIEIKRPTKGLIIEAFSLKDSVCLVTGAFNTGTCALLKDGEILKECIEPYTKTGEFINKAIKDANLFMLSNDKEHLLRITQNGGFIGLYKVDIKNINITPLFEKEYFPVEVKAGNNTLHFTQQARYGYISACITDKYIYGLYCGTKIDDQEFRSNQIHIYNYKGDLINNITLNTALSGIGVDNENKRIFGITAEGEKELCMYIIPDDFLY